MQKTRTDPARLCESAAFSQTAKNAHILQGISRSVLAMHRIQSQSALAAASADYTHAMPGQNGQPIPAINGCLAEGKDAGASSSGGAPVSSAKAKPANEGGMLQNGTIFSPAIQTPRPKILSGPSFPRAFRPRVSIPAMILRRF